jgi:putative membrane protein
MIDYDPHDWSKHLFDVKGSMLREITYRVLVVGIWSVIVVRVHGYLPHIGIPTIPHAMIGTALGFLLVFRTNASYDRFWEGRKQWGGIVNESRNMGRLATVHLSAEPALRNAVLRWTTAFAYATMYSLRNGRGLGPMESQLPREEAEAVLAQPHIPLATAIKVSSLLRSARDRGIISDYIYVALDANMQQLIDYMGACERIHKTPLPFAYVVHLRRSLILYTYTLPFAFVREVGWWTPLAVISVAFVFFGIEEIGVEIEDPFGEDDNDLPLERICGTIERNLVEQLGAEG